VFLIIDKPPDNIAVSVSFHRQGCAITIARRQGLPNFEVGRANITAALARQASKLKVKVDSLFRVQLSM
jgi:hypothetical protein